MCSSLGRPTGRKLLLRRREIDRQDDDPVEGEMVLRFIEVGVDGRAGQRRVVVRI